jgi:phosphatidate cytidylyltransferase
MTTLKTEPKKKSDFWVRTGTGLIMGAVVIGSIIGSQYSFAALMAVVMLLSVREFYNITAPTRTTNKATPYYLPLILLLGATLYVGAYLYANGFIGGHYLLMVPAMLLLFFVLELFADSKDAFYNISLNVVSLVYLAFPFMLVQFLVLGAYGYSWRPMMAVLLLIWANDISAYLVGRQIGKTKLLSRISPGKTIEGSAGGVVGCALIAVGLYYLMPVEGWEIMDWVVIAILTSTFATVGDLIESMLKRNLGIKDSGTLLPGHGGVLDRFDAFFFTVPFVVAYLAVRGLLVIG